MRLPWVDREVFANGYYGVIALRQLWDLFDPLFLVASIKNNVVGYTIGATALQEDCTELPVGWILVLAVIPKARRFGVGRSLTTELCQRLRGVGLFDIRLTVDPVNSAARCLYESIGFQEFESEFGYYGDSEDRILMSLK